MRGVVLALAVTLTLTACYDVVLVSPTPEAPAFDLAAVKANFRTELQVANRGR